MSWWKQILGIGMTGFAPKCDTCGERMDVTEVDLGGTRFRCRDSENDLHKRQREIYQRWIDKIAALEAEIEKEDAMMSNHARRRHGKPKLEVRRR